MDEEEFSDLFFFSDYFKVSFIEVIICNELFCRVFWDFFSGVDVFIIGVVVVVDVVIVDFFCCFG